MICPKCQKSSGDDWSQCVGGCPLTFSPHHDTSEQIKYQTREENNEHQKTLRAAGLHTRANESRSLWWFLNGDKR